MANIMSLSKLQNNSVRTSGFDLSSRKGHTSVAGEILPVKVWEIIPGDDIEIELSSFTRAESLNSSAMTRLKENYDFVFVPTNLLWNKFNTFVSQMGKNNQVASGYLSNQLLTDEHPYFTLKQVIDIYKQLKQRTPQGVIGKDLFGREYHYLLRKLMWYLGYGDLEYYVSKESEEGWSYTNVKLNPFPLLAYQKACSDYFRNSQWEQADASSFNIDYISGESTSLNIPITNISSVPATPHNMFTIKYANWDKDLFMGLLPHAQFGNSATIDMSTLIDFTDTNKFPLFASAGNANVYFTDHNTGPYGTNLVATENSPNVEFALSRVGVEKIAAAMGLSEESLRKSFSILQLRKAEAEQKFREITQSVHQDYQSQIKAHFGVDVSDAYSQRSVWIGGVDGQIDINSVVNSNLADDNASIIRGIAQGAHQGNIKFKSSIHGYLICLKHIKPRLDYSLRSRLAKMFTKVNVADYAVPEFDRIGMDSVQRQELFNLYRQGEANIDDILGYAPRYYDYKTDIDEFVGGFVDGTLQHWIAPLSEAYLEEFYKSTSSQWSYPVMKVNPNILNPIFAIDAGTSDFSQEHFFTVAFFDVKAVRKLDRDGLPY